MGRHSSSDSDSDPWAKEERKEKKKKKKKEKKKKHRERKYSSSESDEEETRRIAKDVEKLKEEARKQKEKMKSMETPEQRYERRMKKREAKKERKENGHSVVDLGYTNISNPFGDVNLTEAFTWGKKLEKQGVKDVNSSEAKRMQKAKQEETRIELEKVKKRRQEREREKELRDEERALEQRNKEAAMFSEWGKQEDDFHLHQARLRSTIRIRDSRAKPIDLLAAYINPDDENLEIQMHEPYAALVGLSIDDLEDLTEDIQVYMKIDKKDNEEFWNDITIIVDDELQKLRKKKSQDAVSNRRDVINSAVKSDVQGIFKGKTHAQLIALQKQISTKIKGGGNIDIGYWESLLQELKAFMAKAKLKERHQSFLKSKLMQLKSDTGGEGTSSQVDQESDDSPAEEEGKEKVKEEEEEDKSDQEEEKTEEEKQRDLDESIEAQRISALEQHNKCLSDYKAGDYAPRLIPFGDVDEEKWEDPQDDAKKLEYLREQVKKGSTVQEEEEADNLFNKEMLRGLEEGEETFNVPAVTSSKKYLWTDKYRPRKPRFFNRVHTGYEWNKYNQTHYDTDNPPPKVVQGYKFNIFYPDLIDKTTNPEYTLTPCDEDEDFAILRFTAGPPYEDIAFKVVNREWEQSNRHGFRCQFYNNIFQLYFHFKRYRYRR